MFNFEESYLLNYSTYKKENLTSTVFFFPLKSDILCVHTQHKQGLHECKNQYLLMLMTLTIQTVHPHQGS